MPVAYVNSKGLDVEIASMAYPHLCSAHAKLIRDQRDGLRQTEIDAMAAEIAARDEAHAAALAAQAEDAAEAARPVTPHF